MNNEHHSHSLCGPTSYNDGHFHHYGTVTDLAPSGVPHTHRFYGDTSFIDDHVHPYYSETGPAIPTEDGRHYHEYRTIAEYTDGHIHYMRGCTSVD